MAIHHLKGAAFACIAGAAGAFAVSTTASAANDVLNPERALYVDWYSSAVTHASYDLSGQDRQNALKIAGYPLAKWFTGGTPAEVQAKAAALVADAAVDHKIPVIVAYNVPFRDCAQYSAGGAHDTAAYKAWIDGLAAGIGDSSAVVLVEPDGLGIIPHYTTINGSKEWCQPADADPATAAASRFEQLNYAVDRLTSLANTAVYLDGTHSAWLGVGDIADRLVKAGVQKADGFFLNVSNYELSSHLEKFGTWISKCIHYGTNPAEGGWRLGHFDWCASQYFPANPNDFNTWVLTDQWYADNVDNAVNPPDPATSAHFVVDTSRNGQGPWTPPAGVYSDAQVWCNPPGRGLGDRPTTDTGNALMDAKLWVKVPGESDGQCTRGTAGPEDPERGIADPAAGAWFKEQAAELVALAQPALPASSCKVYYNVLADWRGGFLSQVTIQNLTKQPVRGWTLGFAFPENERVIEALGANTWQRRELVKASNERWNRVIPPKRFDGFAFYGRQSDAKHDPLLLFMLNGQQCSTP
ncbi:MAG TPA: glycoside hydrolase family 6 protein [Steroidobacteraceae bacterium]|nr:glycoside hydrolase family 6 protein [Steroidobacteraceae bacterium]